MKIRSLKIMIFLILGIGFTSCFEDKGNYDYEALNRVGVTIPFDAMSIARGEYLDVYPGVNLQGDTLGYSERYEYTWEFWLNTSEGKKYLLGNTRNLYYKVDVAPDSYILVFSVKDKETGLTWMTKGSVTVKSEISRGWLLMTEVNENGKIMADMDICAKRISDGTSQVVKNVLKNSGLPESYREGPRAVCFRGTSPGVEDAENGIVYKMIYVLTDKAAGWLDYKTQVWKDDQLIRYQMLDPVGDDYTVKKIYCLDMMKVFAFTDDGGFMTYNAMTGGSVFGEKINFLLENGNQVEFKVAPYLGGSMADGAAILYPYVLYDETHQQFVRCEFNPYSSSNAGCYRILNDWAKTPGKTMRYMQSCGKMSNIYALLKEGEGKFWQYKISVADGNMVAETPVEINAPHLTDQSLVTFHQLYGHLYYTDGKDLYTYRSDRGEIKIRPMDAPVTALATVHVTYSQTDEIDRYIAVATYDDSGEPDNGVLTLFSTESARPEVLNIVDYYKKTGKVVSIDYLY